MAERVGLCRSRLTAIPSSLACARYQPSAVLRQARIPSLPSRTSGFSPTLSRRNATTWRRGWDCVGLALRRSRHRSLALATSLRLSSGRLEYRACLREPVGSHPPSHVVMQPHGGEGGIVSVSPYGDPVIARLRSLPAFGCPPAGSNTEPAFANQWVLTHPLTS